MQPIRFPPSLLGVVLVFLVIASRLPFIGVGFGGDPDAWRVAFSVKQLAETGVYIPSRPPGYPLPEYFGALILKMGLDGPLWLSLPSVLLSAIASLFIFLLALPKGKWVAAAVSLLFAFTPVVFVGSLGAMDYMWGIAFFLAACLVMLRGNWVASGVLLGLAAASRPTYALGFLPLACMLLDFDFRRCQLEAVCTRCLLFRSCPRRWRSLFTHRYLCVMDLGASRNRTRH
ncbi:MAG: glycosyltransferase family 39 protein [Acidobacteriota bacterium]